MKYTHALFFTFVLFLYATEIFAQPGCPAVNSGANQSLPCGVTSTTLNATYFNTGATSNYGVSSIPYAPPASFVTGTSIFVGSDDIWSGVINLPFTFCFYGNSYNQIVVGANGVLTFDVAYANQDCYWEFSSPIPTPGPNTVLQQGLYNNSINGAYHDIDPSVQDITIFPPSITTPAKINYSIQGTFPCRTFVVNYSTVPHYSCNSLRTTQQIVLYETTNVIEVYLKSKPTCNAWNSGNAVVGLQNATGTLGITPPGRNTGVWSATNEAWRFTPNGTSIVTFEWLKAGTVFSTSPSVSVSPTANPTTYTARATYQPCTGGTPVVVTSNVNVSLAGSLNSSITTSTNVSCNGGNNGAATATVSGGNVPVTYGWSNGSNQLSISGLSAGTYVFTANDAANCVRSDTVRITQPPPRTLSVPNVTFNNCSGTGNGDLVAISGGGVYPYTYAWSSTTQTDSILDGVAAGTYTVTMTDAKNCTSTASGTLSITNSPIIFGAPTITNAGCTQGGSITATASGGVGALSYIWSNGTAGNSITNVPTGPYTVTATDQGGCTASATYSVGASGTVVAIQPPTITHVQCNGGSNGAITANATGGTLTYSWSNSQTSQTITGLTAGTYSVTITNQSSCSASASYTITQPTAIVVAAPVIVDATCTTNGNITASASGGSSSFNYIWSNGQMTPMATNLTAGSYTVTITDQTSLCTESRTYTVALIGSPPNIYVATPAPISCATTTQMLTATSVTPMVTYLWSTGSTADNISVSQGGTYIVTATDPANGCTASSSVILPSDTTSPQIVSLAPDTINCTNNTSILFVATTAANASFLWSNGEASNTSVVSTAANYTVTVTNNDNGCTASYTETVIEDKTNPNLTVAPAATLTCTVLSVDIVASSTTNPVSYLWSNGEQIATTSVSNGGNYTVTVTNTRNGCTASASETVAQNTVAPTVSIAPSTFLTCTNPTEVLTASSPLASATFLWSNGANTYTTTVSAIMAYSVTATDPSNGCTASAIEAVKGDLTPPTLSIAPPAVLTCVVSSANLISTTDAANPTYRWNTTETSADINVTSGGQYTLTVTNSDNECTATTSVVVTENKVIPSANISTPNPLGCAVLSQTLTATTNASSPVYSWSNGASTASSTVTTSGGYTVTITNAQNGCTVVAAQTVVDAPPLLFTDTVTQPLCTTFPKTGALRIDINSGTPGYTYLWSDSSRFSSKTNLIPGIYSVTVADAQGCTVSRSFAIDYLFDYTIKASPMAAIDLGESTTLSYTINGTSGLLTNVWKPFRYLDCEDCAAVIASPLSTTLYHIETTNEFGCLASDTVTVFVTPSYDLYVPNAFTPNADGFNDWYEIFGNKKIWKFVEIKMFNRWGEMVFESNDINFKWDGRYRGQLLTPQVLTYTLQLTFINGFTDKLQKGTITIIR